MNIDITNAEALNLAVRCADAGLTWRSGMLSLAGWLCYDVHECMDAVHVDTGEIDSEDVGEFDGTPIKFDDPDTLAFADLRHVGTRACVLECARERWAANWHSLTTPCVTIERVHGGWTWRLSSVDKHNIVGTTRIGQTVATEADAAVCALESSP